RYWKRALLVESKPMDAFVGKLPALLEEARETLLLWSQRPEEFEFAVSLDLPRERSQPISVILSNSWGGLMTRTGIWMLSAILLTVLREASARAEDIRFGIAVE